MQRSSVFSSRTRTSVDNWMPGHSSGSYPTSPSLTNRTDRLPPPTPRPLPTPVVQVNGLPPVNGLSRFPSISTHGHGGRRNPSWNGYPPQAPTASTSGPPQSAVFSDDIDMEYDYVSENMNISPTERAGNGFERYVEDDYGYDERNGERRTRMNENVNSSLPPAGFIQAQGQPPMSGYVNGLGQPVQLKDPRGRGSRFVGGFVSGFKRFPNLWRRGRSDDSLHTHARQQQQQHQLQMQQQRVGQPQRPGPIPVQQFRTYPNAYSQPNGNANPNAMDMVRAYSSHTPQLQSPQLLERHNNISMSRRRSSSHTQGNGPPLEVIMQQSTPQSGLSLIPAQQSLSDFSPNAPSVNGPGPSYSYDPTQQQQQMQQHSSLRQTSLQPPPIVPIPTSSASPPHASPGIHSHSDPGSQARSEEAGSFDSASHTRIAHFRRVLKRTAKFPWINAHRITTVYFPNTSSSRSRSRSDMQDLAVRNGSGAPSGYPDGSSWYTPSPVQRARMARKELEMMMRFREAVGSPALAYIPATAAGGAGVGFAQNSPMGAYYGSSLPLQMPGQTIGVQITPPGGAGAGMAGVQLQRAPSLSPIHAHAHSNGMQQEVHSSSSSETLSNPAGSPGPIPAPVIGAVIPSPDLSPQHPVSSPPNMTLPSSPSPMYYSQNQHRIQHQYSNLNPEAGPSHAYGGAPGSPPQVFVIPDSFNQSNSPRYNGMNLNALQMSSQPMYFLPALVTSPEGSSIPLSVSMSQMAAFGHPRQQLQQRQHHHRPNQHHQG